MTPVGPLALGDGRVHERVVVVWWEVVGVLTGVAESGGTVGTLGRRDHLG